MKTKPNLRFKPALLGTFGAIISFIAVVLMATGDLQKIIPFNGSFEEGIFTLFVVLIGVGSSIMAISSLSREI